MTRPARRRPSSESPIKLVANVEEVRTSSTSETASPIAPVIVEAAPEQSEVPEQRANTLQTTETWNMDTKRPVTIGLRTQVKKRAETAVLRTGGYEGGYRTFAALVEGSVERELERLAEEFNNGEPFPPNAGDFRQGRPLGS